MPHEPVPSVPAAQPAWHAFDPQRALRELDSRPGGLSSAEAAARLRAHGPNVLPHKLPPSLLAVVARQFKSPLIYVLAAAAAASAATGDLKDALFIAFVLAVNAAIGSIQEWRAEKSSQALQRLLRTRASVVRDGEQTEIDSEEVVPGDVIWLESGNRVPADARLLEANGFEVDESLLTGESLAVHKTPEWTGEAGAPLSDRLNMVHAGSVVRRGRARGVVAATGNATAIGRLAERILFAPETKPPLVQRMERFSTRIAIALIGVSALIAAVGVFGQDRGIREMFFFVVALAVSAIPEGLPAALAVVLSIATSRMSRRGVIVRRLPAVEGLGSCSLIASDKTGTLTCNELTVKEIRLPDGDRLEASGQGFSPEGALLRDGAPVEPSDAKLPELMRAMLLCNEGDLYRHGEGWSWRGDPTDVALLSLAHKAGWKREAAAESHPKINEIPFEPERRFAATFHRAIHPDGDGKVDVYVKGAPEKVLGMCGRKDLSRHAAVAEEMASRGFRVLAFAHGHADGSLGPGDAPEEPAHLEFLGFAGMIDPLRAGVREAVAACQSAGVKVWMVTGDHPVTALAIARDLGLAAGPEAVVTGADLQELAPERLAETVGRASVYARVAPDQKLQLVEAAKAAGHFVAVTGDGINDAPALRAAHIGVAMGKGGTDVARDAADLVLTDDNFASVVNGVEEGRVAYQNIRNVITLLVSTAVAEVLLSGGAVLLGMPLPLLPVQLLWLNLVTNGIQDVALAFEPGQGDELGRPPRPAREPLFNRLMAERVLLSGGVMGLMGLGLFAWLLGQGMSEPAARNVMLLFMVLFENVQIGNCRSETISAFRLSPLRSPILLFGTLAAFLLHVAMMYLPLGRDILGTGPVAPELWAVVIPLALVVLVVMEAQKWAWRKFRL